MIDYIFSSVLAIGTILLQISLVSGFVFYLISPNNSIFNFVKKYGAWIGFLLAALATLGSLIYSEIIGFPPCKLCWFGRIAIFPQVLLFGLLLAVKEKSYLLAIRGLAIFGILISGYHLIVEWSGGNVPCSASAGEISCAVRYVFEFNYVSIPMMALTTSLTFLALSYLIWKE